MKTRHLGVAHFCVPYSDAPACGEATAPGAPEDDATGCDASNIVIHHISTHASNTAMDSAVSTARRITWPWRAAGFDIGMMPLRLGSSTG